MALVYLPKFEISLLSRGVEVVGGWVRERENKAKLSPAGAGARAELGKIGKYYPETQHKLRALYKYHKMT